MASGVAEYLCPCNSHCYARVQNDEMGVSEWCGKYNETLGPGVSKLGCDCCGCCYTTKTISTRVRQSQTRCETKTRDNVFVKIETMVQHQPMLDKIPDSIYKLQSHTTQIDSYVADVVRAQVPKMTLEEVFSHKDAIAEKVNEQITEKMALFGWKIVAALVTNVDPDGGVKVAMNAIEASKKSKIAAETKAEADRFVAIKHAEALAEAKALSGLGIARQRAAIVQGLRDSIGADKAMDQSAVSELLLITQYFDALQHMAESKGNTIFVPTGVEAVSQIADQIRDGVLAANAARQ